MGIGLLAWVAILLMVVPVAFLVWGVIAVDRRGQAMIQQNLARTSPDMGLATAADRSDWSRLARRLTSKGYVAKLDRLLSKAGRPAAWPLERVLVIKPLLALGGAVFGVLYTTGNPGVQSLLLSISIVMFAYFLPDILAYNTGIKRREAIQLELPNTLDQLLISVEAGLGLESAMARVASNSTGPLAEEMGRTLQDLQVGRSRRDAYQAMADRTGADDLRSFVRAIVQADKYGIGIARVLKSQAGQMRIKRRQRAEEQAMKLPVKILFPLLLFIFPALFIVILGPAAIDILTSGLFS